MFGQEGWILVSLAFFLWTSTLSRSTITQKEKSSANTAISTSRLDKNEYVFAFMHDRLSFSFSFLLQLFLKVNCLSLNIVLWLPLINFHFFPNEWIYIIILSDKYWKNKVIRKNWPATSHVKKIIFHRLRTSLCKNQTSWEMKVFNPPSNFACS